MKERIPVYFVPGLGAGSKIFEYLNLPEDRYELHYLEWLIPESEDEPLEHYAKRMAQRVKSDKPVLVGVSFGGVLVQEMSELIPTRQTIIISSLKSRSELPNRLKWIRKLGLYKLFPTGRISRIDDFSRFNFHQSIRKKAELYNRYMSVRNEKYLNWAIKTVLHWKGSGDISNVVHIHGTQDEIFPIKHIDNCIPVEKGTHAMIITRAKRISEIIINSLET